MKTFDLRALAVAVAATMLAFGAANAQTPSTNTGPATSPGQGQAGGMGKGAETGKAGTTTVPASPNASRSGMWSAETFARLDTNKDGQISREEAQADPMMRDHWNKLDAKNSGRVSRADFDKFGATQAK